MIREGEKTPYLSVIIPAYNEEKRIMPTLGRIKSYLDKQEYSSEMIVVDDGSDDRTADVVEDYRSSWPILRLLRNGNNRGKGYSVKMGFMDAEGEVLLFTDADLSTPIDETDKLLAAIRSGASVAIGSRALKDSDVRVHQPWYREAMGKTFNRLVRWITLSDIHDTQCGFKAFTRKAAEAIVSRQKLSGFGFDVEMLFIAKKLGMTVREIPVVWLNDFNSRVRAFSDSISMLLDLFRIRWFHRRSRYP